MRAPAQCASPLSVYLAKIWGFARLGPTTESLAPEQRLVVDCRIALGGHWYGGEEHQARGQQQEPIEKGPS